ncbi:hypothetical protein F511_28436 [Dorcoceras hygrometricum]|uniref:Uncharacterized protein n=1 Tax=Dorcoceras hygrometricum TaxID=472368 RepID=A0A2Z7BB83_9LAMI|nr:hypothetical protein F511_28436 [Dorcoceras hygrometricum]
METSKVKSGVQNQAEAKLNQLEHSESAASARRRWISWYIKREPAGTSKWTIDDDVIGEDIMFSRCRKISCRKMMYQSRATVDPVASFSAIDPVDMVSRRKKSRSSEAWQPGAKYPVDKETAVARSVVTKKRQQLCEQLLNNLLENIQPFNAINAQDEKNQWLRLSRANYLNSREQDLYYSGK